MGRLSITGSALNRLRMLVAILLAVVTVAGGMLAWSRLRPGPPIEIMLPESAPTEGRVFIGGMVASPGYYPFAGGDSIDNLIAAAGGVTGDARLLELEIRVGEAGEPQAQKIDINRAEPWLLEALPGIGEARARAIIDHRLSNWPFRSVDDLAKVDGIGAVTLERIRPLITVSGQPAGR